eukprot:gene11655-biopygen7832
MSTGVRTPEGRASSHSARRRNALSKTLLHAGRLAWRAKHGATSRVQTTDGMVILNNKHNGRKGYGVTEA